MQYLLQSRSHATQFNRSFKEYDVNDEVEAMMKKQMSLSTSKEIAKKQSQSSDSAAAAAAPAKAAGAAAAAAAGDVVVPILIMFLRHI